MRVGDTFGGNNRSSSNRDGDGGGGDNANCGVAATSFRLVVSRARLGVCDATAILRTHARVRVCSPLRDISKRRSVVVERIDRCVRLRQIGRFSAGLPLVSRRILRSRSSAPTHTRIQANLSYFQCRSQMRQSLKSLFFNHVVVASSYVCIFCSGLSENCRRCCGLPTIQNLPGICNSSKFKS